MTRKASKLVMWSLAAWIVVALAGDSTGAAQGSVTASGRPSVPFQTGGRSFAIDDLFDLERISRAGPRVSPDGGWVAYTVSTSSLEGNRIESRIWMAPISAGEPMPMTGAGGSASQPRWSPDGRYLSFLSSRGDGRQVWVLHRSGGEAVQLTDEHQRISFHEWSPDGRRLLLVMMDPQSPELEGKYGTRDGRRVPPPKVIDRLHFKRSGVGYLESRWSHLYIFDTATKLTRQLTSGDDFDDSAPAWSPDGRRVAFVRKRSDQADYNTDIWVVNADNRDRGRTARRLTTNPGSDGPSIFSSDGPSWSPDGRTITYATRISTDWRKEFYDQSQIAVQSVEGGEPTILTGSLDREAQSPRFSADGDTVEFLLFDGGRVHLASVPVSGGAVDRLIDGSRVVVARDSAQDKLVALISEPHIPGNLFLLEDPEPRQLTRHNDDLLAKIELGAVEKLRSTSFDGTEVEAIVYKPPAFDPATRYPALLWCHAGPVGQFNLGFSIEGQVLAANGYVVAMTNPRGSFGRGAAYSKALWQRNGELDVQDALSSIDRVVEVGYADPERLGVGGWSYGGQLTSYLVSQSDRFKAAVAGAPISILISNYGHDSWLPFFEREFGHPWEAEARQHMDRYSSMFLGVEKIVTPTLFMAGDEDWTTPVINAEHMYQAMKRLGRADTQLVVYEGQGHSISLPSYRKDRLERWVDWYDKYLKDDPS